MTVQSLDATTHVVLFKEKAMAMTKAQKLILGLSLAFFFYNSDTNMEPCMNVSRWNSA